MNLRFLPATAVIGCALLASCYPYDESQNKKPGPPPKKTVTSSEQQKIQEQRDRMKAEEELKNKTSASPDSNPDQGVGTMERPIAPPVEEKRMDIAIASKVPGKEGYVFSPFNNKLIDVRGIPSGTLVADPTYPESAKKHFRVP